ncbi:MAG: nucleoside kinase [Candidatus Marinimicrobia bacterium]|nr:nucleoside kinase [Candidatus Neomarinimicrobiota bacterium]MCF7839583.1 nucleoside kinase [Candidatus Neomarinimicrobiota bacterium]MCF7903334.1 nucleoside kinase [Candidatus Neomarinimicrobiota bacterium]
MNDRLHQQRMTQRALAFVLAGAVHDIYNGQQQLVIDHSFGDGYFCHFTDYQPLSKTELMQIHKRMQLLIHQYGRIEKRAASPRDWRHLSGPDHTNHRPPILKIGNFSSPSYEETELDLRKLPEYELKTYNRGFLLRDGRGPGGTLRPFLDYPKLFQTMEEYEAWGRILNVHNVSELNKQVKSRNFKELIWLAEGLQEKKIVQVADAITQRKARLVFIAGPSSSGKTTFTKRLIIQLKVNGINARTISMDDYFIDRDKMTPLSDGTLDFESIDCVNLADLQSDTKTLLNHGAVSLRSYDFRAGKSRILLEKIKLGAEDLLIFEGIHGLNPVITENLDPSDYYKIYISALTQLNIDKHHPVSTSDARLLRRIVRDSKFRGYTAHDTLTRWQSVRFGEVHNIFPYQEQCDIMFNSALVYELSILKRHALPLLRKAPSSPDRDRLLILLHLIQSIPERFVPGTSILREFIGKSYFRY